MKAFLAVVTAAAVWTGAGTAAAQTLVLDDAMAGATLGTRSGGTFAEGGWKVTGTMDYVYWHLPQSLPRGAVSFDVKGLRPGENRTGIEDKVDIFHMYDWTVGNSDTQYSGYRDNPYKHFIRKTGAADTRPGKTDSMEMVWVIAPNYMEPDTSVLSWDPNVTYTFREEWGPDGAGNTVIRTWRDGVLIMTMSEPGAWAPQGHAVKVGVSRHTADHGAPLDAVFSNMKVWNLEGSTGSSSSGGGITAAPPDALPQGLVRVQANSLTDDTGAFLGLGTTYMTAMWQARNNRELLRSDLRFFRQNGINYIRILAQVGGDYWRGLDIAPLEQRNSDGIVPAWSDWTAQLQDLLDIVFEEGLRTEITIFGSAGDLTGGAGARQQVVEMVLSAIVGREHKVLMLEVANEGWQTGFPDAAGLLEMQSLGSLIAGATDVPVAITSNHGVNTLAETYAGTNADIATWHFSRDLGEDNGWGPVHATWFADAVPGVPPVSSNEPIGPGSSVASEERPIRLVMAAAFAWVAKLPMYVFHTSAGVRHSQTFESMAGATSFNHVRRIIPGDVASWVRHDAADSQSPFTIYSGGQANRTSVQTGAGDGCVRAIGARKGPELVFLPIGIGGGGLTLEAREAVTARVHNPLTGEIVQELSMTAGQQVTLPQGPEAYVITNAVVPGSVLGGQGLVAQYFNNVDFTAPVATRVDRQVDFDWGSGVPAPGVDGETFSVRWLGQVDAEFSETYTFHVTSDDGARLFIDGVMRFEDWTMHGPVENTASVMLTAGRHDIALEYFDDTGGASIRLEWSSASQARQVIPASRLFPELRNDAVVVSQVVPRAMLPGASAPVTVTMRNTGLSTWTAALEYRLGAQNPQDTTLWGDGRTHLQNTDVVRPGETVTFAFNITAPMTPGLYNFQRRMLREGVAWFGETTPNVVVAVGTEADAGVTMTPDAGTVVTPDAGTTMTLDAGTVVTPDAGTTMTPDAGTTVMPDAGNTTMRPDAGGVSLADAGVVDPPEEPRPVCACANTTSMRLPALGLVLGLVALRLRRRASRN